MALIRCGTSGGGGMPDGEVLWTIPTGTTTLGSGFVDLISGKSIANYDYLKIIVKLNSNTDKTISLLVSVDDFRNKSGFVANVLNPSVYSYYSSSTTISRQFGYGTDTNFGMGQAFLSGGSANNTWLLPIELRGIKL